MKSLWFVFDPDVDDQALLECLIRVQSLDLLAAHPDVDCRVVTDEEGKVQGATVTGEHELVTMIGADVRRLLRDAGISFNQQEHFESDSSPGLVASTLPELLGTLLGNAPGIEDPMVPPGVEASEWRAHRGAEPEEAATTSPGVTASTSDYGQYPSVPRSSDKDSAFVGESGFLMVPLAQPPSKDRPDDDPLVRDPLFGFALPLQALPLDEQSRALFAAALDSGLAFLRLGNLGEARQRLEDALQIRPGEPQVSHYLGLVLDNLEDYDRAEVHLRAAIQAAPSVGATHFYLANVLHKRGDFEGSIAAYKRALACDPKVAITYNNLGWVYSHLDRLGEAERAFEEALTRDPHLAYAHHGLGCVRLERGEAEAALEAFAQALELRPEYHAARSKLGWCCLVLERYDEAVQAFRWVSEQSPVLEDRLGALFSLGHVHLAQERFVQARDVFVEVSKRTQVDIPEALLFLGLAQLRLGELDRAVRSLRDYLAKAAEQVEPEAYKWLAQAYLAGEKLPSALRYVRLALQAQPKDHEVHLLLGQVKLGQGRLAEALAAFLRATELDPTAFEPHLHAALAYEELGDAMHTEEQLRKALALDPHSLEATSCLGWLFAETARMDEALVLFERVVELCPTDLSSLNNLAWLHAQMGKFDEAIGVYQDGLLAAPGSVLLRGNLGAVFFQVGRLDEAREAFEEALALGGDDAACANASFYLGRMAVVEHDYEAAHERFSQAVLYDPKLAAAWYQLAGVCQQLGRPREARDALEHYTRLEDGASS